MEQMERNERHTPHGTNGKALDPSHAMGCPSPGATGRTLIQTPNGVSELAGDFIGFWNPPKTEAWEIVLHRLRVENAALANVAAVVKEIAKVREPEPLEQPQYLKLKAAAKLIGLSTRKLRLLTQLGEIEVVKGDPKLGEGKTTGWCYEKAELLAYMKRRKSRF